MFLCLTARGQVGHQIGKIHLKENTKYLMNTLYLGGRLLKHTRTRYGLLLMFFYFFVGGRLLPRKQWQTSCFQHNLIDDVWSLTVHLFFESCVTFNKSDHSYKICSCFKHDIRTGLKCEHTYDRTFQIFMFCRWWNIFLSSVSFCK